MVFKGGLIDSLEVRWVEGVCACSFFFFECVLDNDILRKEFRELNVEIEGWNFVVIGYFGFFC